MSAPRDPRAVAQPTKPDESTQHEPRAPGDQADKNSTGLDHPGKPFRTPNKTKTHPAPERATDGEPTAKPK